MSSYCEVIPMGDQWAVRVIGGEVIRSFSDWHTAEDYRVSLNTAYAAGVEDTEPIYQGLAE